MNIEQCGFLFIICLFVGAGIGFLCGNIQAGGAIGLGLGVICIALFRKRV